MSECKFDVRKLDELKQDVKEQNLLNNQQSVELAQLRMLAEQSSKIQEQNATILKNHDELLVGMKIDVSRNTKDMELHIKRTNILQSRQYYVIIMLAFALGAGLIQAGSGLLPFLFKIF